MPIAVILGIFAAGMLLGAVLTLVMVREWMKGFTRGYETFRAHLLDALDRAAENQQRT